LIALPGLLFAWALFWLVLISWASGNVDGQGFRNGSIYVAVLVLSFALARFVWPRRRKAELSQPIAK
jgi:hypothetical protein